MNNANGFHMKAQLQCGIWVEVKQPGTSQTLEFTFSPADGTKIEDTAWIKDGVLRINATVPAILGMREFFALMFRGPQKPKNWLQKLLDRTE